MESGHLTEADLRSYVERKLAAPAIVALHDHVDECADCAGRLASLRLGSQFPPLHASEEDLVLFVDSRLASEQMAHVERHLGVCGECAGAVEDLRLFREQLMEQRNLAEMPPRRRFAMRWAVAAAAGIVLILSVPLLMKQNARVPRGPSFVLSVKDAGGVIGLAESGEWTGTRAGSTVAEALRSESLPMGPGPLAAPSRGTLRGGESRGPGFEPEYPTGVRVVSDRPEFEWTPLTGATAYEVAVFDEHFDRAARSGRITETRWQTSQPLERGKTYVWQVTAIRGGTRVTAPVPPQPEARFVVIDSENAQRIAAAQARTPPSHLELAAMYAKAGARREAASELDRLSELNPGSLVVESLRRSLATR